MKKIIYAITLGILLSSCGEAERITVESKLSNNGFIQHAFGDHQIDPEIEGLTIISVPRDEEIPLDFSFRPSDELFSQVFGELKYRSRVPREIKQESRQWEKAKGLMYYVLTAGDVRDQDHIKLKLMNRVTYPINFILGEHVCHSIKKGENKDKCLTEQDGRNTRRKRPRSCSEMEENFDKFIDMNDEQKILYQQSVQVCKNVDNILTSVSCFEIASGDDLGKCRVTKGDDTVDTATYPASCADLSDFYERFVDASKEISARMELFKKDCATIVNGENSKLAFYTTKIEETEYHSNKTVKEEFVAKMLFDLATAANDKTMAVVGNGGEFEFSANFKTVNKLSLNVDFGFGPSDFSMENGLITNVKLFEEVNVNERQNVTKLEFDIDVNGRFKVHVTSGHTFGIGEYDDRFIGDAYFYFPDGRDRKGIFSLQLKKLEAKIND